MAQVRVRYVGPSDERRISTKDLKAHGTELSQELVWNRWNGFSLVIDADEKFIQILRDQDHFTVNAVKEDGSDGETVATASNPNKVETAVAVEEGKSTQKSTVNK